MRSDNLATLAGSVRVAARRTAQYWPETVAADDVEQDLWVRLLEGSADALTELANSPRAGVTSALHKMGMQVAAHERDDYELFSGNYHYSGDEVRALLSEGVLTITESDTVAEKTDLLEALPNIPDAQRAVLTRRYVEGVRFERGSADEKTLQRAVRTLTSEMNRSFNRRRVEHDGPALRKDQR